MEDVIALDTSVIRGILVGEICLSQFRGRRAIIPDVALFELIASMGANFLWQEWEIYKIDLDRVVEDSPIIFGGVFPHTSRPPSQLEDESVLSQNFWRGFLAVEDHASLRTFLEKEAGDKTIASKINDELTNLSTTYKRLVDIIRSAAEQVGAKGSSDFERLLVQIVESEGIDVGVSSGQRLRIFAHLAGEPQYNPESKRSRNDGIDLAILRFCEFPATLMTNDSTLRKRATTAGFSVCQPLRDSSSY